ncbi:SMI1/KNR4 family protein [Persicobacter psychrovividus]|uniref:Knr4/Smi1-like domain-containing protein n=1 Tax=Persicobacter psychrovividus TaxID=387638 RepID=A0ABM7VD22_9BACT|nr:hypothetical protein PEPS_11170 [Persicobacter psychrovividus]
MKNIKEHFNQFDLSIEYTHSDDEILNFQSLMEIKGITLPEEYYEFIKYYGCAFIMSEVRVKCENTIPNVSSEGNYVSIGAFLNWTNNDFSINKLRKSLCPEQFSEDFIPFAEGVSGDYIGFKLLPDGKYYIAYWAHEELPLNDTFLIADDFESFILSIVPYEFKIPVNVKFLPVEEKLTPKMIEFLKKTGQWNREE